ncbi:hypothetical protein [Streptomyces sp. NPDC093991]|uniref:hypothetical protein n=1 Tax=unclassified Streptomyces TaxID=2593676 RepID=UPI00342EF047
MHDVVAGGQGGARHVAVFNVPMHGHVIPTLAVVRELVDRGHRVSYAVTAEFADGVHAAGATPVLHDAPRQERHPRTWPRASPWPWASM